MPASNWRLEGDYFEACNCDILCPCIISELKAVPTEGHCAVALAFHIERGHYEQTQLDDLNFIVVADAPGPMGEGNWTVGLIVDERADESQRDALSRIVSGEAGGPMAHMAPLIGRFVGVERHPITYEQQGMSRRVEVPGAVTMAINGLRGVQGPETPIWLDNVAHPASSRLALARAERSQANIFGMSWDKSGNNGHFAPFAWQP